MATTEFAEDPRMRTLAEACQRAVEGEVRATMRSNVRVEDVLITDSSPMRGPGVVTVHVVCKVEARFP